MVSPPQMEWEERTRTAGSYTWRVATFSLAFAGNAFYGLRENCDTVGSGTQGYSLKRIFSPL
ncbi:b27b5cc9-8514-4440-8b66-eefabde4898f [Sclerotinia trifoliorum]|uniref:B27b5cc9-8514-4440-8b66-eefabde4898f n=1 Tax=Sclerotinia trifoliorum TaxID=28548 RepID=A0A8H2VWW5_9HELO|nr:b27b5cc9-8514-4440-8b66-eefabde4898f [Sclerotinia trifoliorum]